MALFTDDFTRADESPLGSPYTIVGAGSVYALTANQVVWSAAVSFNDAFVHSGGYGTLDYIVQATVVVAGNLGGIVGRYTGQSGSGYSYAAYLQSSNGVWLWRNAPEGQSLLGHATDFTVTSGVPYTLALSMDGARIVVSVDGINRLEVTDAVPIPVVGAGGGTGFATSWDDLTVTAIAVAGFVPDEDYVRWVPTPAPY